MMSSRRAYLCAFVEKAWRVDLAAMMVDDADAADDVHYDFDHIICGLRDSRFEGMLAVCCRGDLYSVRRYLEKVPHFMWFVCIMINYEFYLYLHT